MDILMELAAAVLAALLLRKFVFMLVRVEGMSMRDTIKSGDILFALRPYMMPDHIKRGRVFICRYPGSKQNYVKRLVGLPGDTLEVRAGRTYIDGVLLEESYVARPARRDFGPVTLKKGQYFVMGDNRASSRDSRTVGPLLKADIKSVVLFRIWPFDKAGPIKAQAAFARQD